MIDLDVNLFAGRKLRGVNGAEDQKKAPMLANGSSVPVVYMF